MAASTNLLLPYVEVGQLAPETTLNTALSYVDDALAGYATKSVAGSAHVTLTETEARSLILRFSGLLTGSINVIVPTREQTHIVVNDTTGAYTLTVKTTAGTGVAITQGTKALIYCDGVNVVAGPGGTGSGVTDGDKGDITVSSSGTVWTVDNDVVTYAKMQNVSVTDRLLGRDTAGAGDIEELTLSAVLDFVGSPAQGDILYRGAATWTRLGFGTSGYFLQTQGTGANPQWAAAGVTDGDKGDITVSASGATWTIDADVVTYAKMQNVSATSRFLGRITGGAGDTEELTGTQATTLLDAVVGDSGSGGVKGLAPATGAGDAAAGKFLKADATWAVPSATLSGGAANKVAYWTSSSALSNDASLHWDATTDVLGIIATAGGTSGIGILVLGLGTLPTTGPADTVQLLAMDEAAGVTGLGVWGEGTTVKHLLGRSALHGTHTRSATMTQGVLIDQASNNDAILQLQASGTVAHGITALVATSIYGDFRQAAAGGGGLDIRGFSEAALGLSLYSYTVTNPDTSKTVTSTAATQFSFAKKSGASVSAMDASVNLVCFSDVFLEGNRWILDMDGDTWQTGTLTATSAILSGTIVAKRTVEANTAGSGAPNVLAATETMNVLTNEGAAAKNYHTLPTAVAGYVFTFVSQDADLMRVTAAAGDTIRVAGGVTAAAGYIENGAQGDFITLISINATEWWDVASRGTWTPT